MRMINRSLTATAIALVASLVSCAGIFLVWGIFAQDFSSFPIVEHRPFGIYVCHSRLWDVFLGLFAFPSVFAGITGRYALDGEEARSTSQEDFVAFLISASLSCAVAHFALLKGVDLGDAATLAAIAAIAVVVTIGFLLAESSRVGVLVFLSACLGVSLSLGAATGLMLTVFFLIICGTTAIVYLSTKRRREVSRTDVASA